MPVQIKIKEKDGWKINPDNKIVNSIFRDLGKYDGKCSYLNSYDNNQICPCDDYLLYDKCMCNLYIRKD